MSRLIGVINVDTLERRVVKATWNRHSIPGELECGWYRTFWLTLDCKECSGTGGEEISGGHKKECDKCFGSGVNPSYLKEFEENSFSVWARTHTNVWGLSPWHPSECTCDKNLSNDNLRCSMMHAPNRWCDQCRR